MKKRRGKAETVEILQWGDLSMSREFRREIRRSGFEMVRTTPCVAWAVERISAGALDRRTIYKDHPSRSRSANIHV